MEDVQADDVIRLENLPPDVPANVFLSLLAMADSAGSSNNSICERLASFLADAYGSNINAAPAISVGTRAPRKRYSGEIPASPNRDARMD